MSEKVCFVIAPIGEAESDTRKRSDQVLKHVIAPAALACGYKAIRADQISEPGMITSQVIQHIVEDPLVIADLTDRNPNVFYELAIRHAIRKPLVQLIKKGEQIPFDVAGTRTIHVDHRDLDSVEEAKREIGSQIRALENDSSKLETPISVSLDLQMLRQSDNPEQRSLADVLSAVTELRSSVSGIEKRLENPDSLIPLPFLAEMIERRDIRSSRTRSMLADLRHMIRELTSEDEKPDSKKSKTDHREILMRIEHLTRMIGEREF
ncbi:hypothetical protein DyAD56_22840 [Dyella sp. AD56]|uniref:hypothetical protein n=1 Tax=Dyella sp. AD56 TaxID=1528744 RepID=UPI000C84F813|nr:hypothetical protein [Dyella sp. AD56]PMQ02716.1 hypothetical protein DyAD56_22840 [Dyella sp. AD56]